MSPVQSTPFAPLAARAGARPTVQAAPPPALSAAEEARIAAAFPARPQVAQRLYGPGPVAAAAPEVGARLDVHA